MSENAKKAREDKGKDEPNKRGIGDDEEEPAESERSWKKKKLRWLKTIAKITEIVPISRVHVAEIYSPERVNKVAAERGMKVGLSMDLITGWNFDRKEDRELAERYIREYKPTFLIGSPMCTMFS